MSEEKDTPLEAFASLKHSGVTPQKVRRIVDLIRGRSVDEALAILRFSPHSASGILYKLIVSAQANYANLLGRDDDLFVSSVYVDEGKTYKRGRPRARGSSARILKRGSHVTVTLSKEVR
ncbi:50S ribosomal protein L22 [Tropheryma whipplei]|uniref:50S ribosomal protein L22 n=1 Tax=Tropheryma whipplei TaxID=2039 RepID=UPI0004BBB63F|nr:50S ribosomal protein L22 [Tropheryma whipplei]